MNDIDPGLGRPLTDLERAAREFGGMVAEAMSPMGPGAADATADWWFSAR